MSRFLDKVKEAELRRARVIAERKRLEAEAMAARPPATGRQASETAARRAPQDPPAARNHWIGICIALLLGVVVGYLFSRTELAPGLAPVVAPVAPEPGGRLELKLERDLDSFSVRLKEKR